MQAMLLLVVASHLRERLFEFFTLSNVGLELDAAGGAWEIGED